MSYIPALRYESLTRFYDPVLRATLKEDRFKRLLVEQAALQPGHRVLDVGCGTATLTILLKQACAAAEVTGLDGDAKVLDLARTKIEAAGLDITLKQGLGSEAPFPPASFDRVVSSLVFHHLTTEEKRRTLKRVRELLKSGGEVHIADWGKAQNPAMRVAFLVAVGTALTGRPPHRSERAQLAHSAPVLGSGVEATFRPGMYDAGTRDPAFG